MYGSTPCAAYSATAQRHKESQIWFSGTTGEALDFVCDLLAAPIT
ncbi:hypothetical protein [Micromonospora tarapacensis]|nr:hypothetical protein [Micromonospora tarapacensis]